MTTATTTRDSRLAILLDVDGTLDPDEAKPTRRPAGFTTHHLRYAGDGPYVRVRFWLNPSHGEALLRMAADLDADLIWCTSMTFQANRMISPLVGLPELPVINFSSRIRDMVAPWKYPDVATAMAGRPIIWFDNNFHNKHLLTAQADFLLARTGTPTLLHRVDPTIALAENDFDTARRWWAERTQKANAT